MPEYGWNAFSVVDIESLRSSGKFEKKSQSVTLVKFISIPKNNLVCPVTASEI